MPTQPYIIEGKRVPSVTTVLGKFKDPGPLQYWAWNVSNKVLLEAVDLIKHTTREPNKIQKLDMWLKTDPLSRADFRKEMKDAANAGTIAHEIIEKWIGGTKVGRQAYLESITLMYLIFEYRLDRETALAALTAVDAFRQWTYQTRFELCETELPLLSRKHGYGGTLDCVGRLFVNGVWILILFDWKTSNAVYADYMLQVAAYRQLWEENYPTQPISHVHLIRFDKKTADPTHYQFRDLTEALECFLHLRRCYDLMKVLEKRV